jgi:hypothetical protein
MKVPYVCGAAEWLRVRDCSVVTAAESVFIAIGCAAQIERDTQLVSAVPLWRMFSPSTLRILIPWRKRTR